MLTWLLVTNALALLLFMTGTFLVAKRRKRLDTVDTAWGLAFVVVAFIGLGYEWHLRTVVIALLVCVWAVRLSNHLLERSRTWKEDPRYVELSKKWKGNFWLQAYARIFLVQGALVWLISLPIATAVSKDVRGSTVLLVLGTVVWLGGFVVESIADRQLVRFTQTHRGEIMQSGLWRYSRHPNYFGEIVQWTGIAVAALGAHNGWIGLAGPLVLALTIIFISGLPPIEKKRAGNLEYQEYKRRTSPLIPWLPKD